MNIQQRFADAIRRYSRNWDESKVNRDDDGKFAEGENHIGRTWRSKEGDRSIVGLHPSGKLEVKTGESKNHELIHPTEIEKRISFDTRNLESHTRMQDASKKRDSDDAAKESAKRDTRGFTDSMPPMQKRQVEDALSKIVNHNGAGISRRDLVDKYIADGAMVKADQKTGTRRLEHPNGAYLDQAALSKTGMDYAEYRSKNITSNAVKSPLNTASDTNWDKLRKDETAHPESRKPGIPGMQRALFDSDPGGQKSLFDYVPPKKADSKKKPSGILQKSLLETIDDDLKTKAANSAPVGGQKSLFARRFADAERRFYSRACAERGIR